MKTLFRLLLVLLPFAVGNVIAAPAHHQQTTTKQSVTPAKKTALKKPNMKKSAEKNPVKKKTSRKTGANNKTAGKKSAAKTNKKITQKQAVATNKSAQSPRRKAPQKEIKKANKAKTTRAAQQKVTKTENRTAQTAPLSQVKRAVIVPKCQDSQVFNVLSDAFKRQGDATGVQMTVKQIRQARETHYYPQQGIRSCHALVETYGQKYQTDYSVILNGNSFFVQVENAQPSF